MRLRRSDLGSPGWTRRRAGRGFRYLDEDRHPLHDPESLARVRALAVPPAWADVWISPWPNGHVQATGTDAAGRRQYRYHDEWRRQRDAHKHDAVLELAHRLPRARTVTTRALRRADLDRDRVLAAAFRMLDLGSFRIGSESYAASHDTYGLATLRREHVRVEGRSVTFHYVAKGSHDRVQRVVDGALAGTLGALLARRDRSPELLAWRTGQGWHDVHSADVNEYVREVTGGAFTAKDFRTWNATVLMAQLLALADPPRGVTARRRVVREAYRGVADYLGNTPAVARGSYVDPRVVDLYLDGVVLPERSLPTRRRDLPVHGAVERAVLRMIRDPPALTSRSVRTVGCAPPPGSRRAGRPSTPAGRRR